MRPYPYFIIIIVLALAGAAFAANAPEAFTDELNVPSYDCTFSVRPSANAAAASAVRVALEIRTGNSVQVAITQRKISFDSFAQGRKVNVGSTPVNLKTGEAQQITLHRRDNWLAISLGNTIVYRVQVAKTDGNEGTIIADSGWTFSEPAVQRLEPVAFSDNFMRTADEQGQWVTMSGSWGLQSAWDTDPHGSAKRFNNALYAQNPFAWIGRGGAAPALCTTGAANWEDYTFTAAVRPSREGAVGMTVNMTDGKNGLLLRWTPGNDRGPNGNSLALFNFRGGQITGDPITSVPGGYIADQWYRVSIVSALDGVRVLIDGKERLSATKVTPWRGGVGLYVEGAVGATFDDITVYGRTLKKDLIAEAEQSRIQQHFLDDQNGMKEWATAQSDWQYGPQGMQVSKYDFYGDQWMILPLTPSAGQTGQLTMVLCGAEQSADQGYRLVINQDVKAGKLTYSLFQNAKSLATKTTEPLTANEAYSIRFRRAGEHLTVDLDGEMVLEANGEALNMGLRPAYKGTGCFSRVSDVITLSRNYLDYAFTEATVDWYSESTWLPTVRWACSPKWSFMSGWSRGDAVMWHKMRFTGDQSFQAYIGYKMEYPREVYYYEQYQHYHDINLTICGDGFNPRSGYTITTNTANSDGIPSSETVLYRNGLRVASSSTTVPGRWGNTHRQWFNLDLRKHGETVEFWFEGDKIIQYKDPNPIEGGSPAIWTNNAGLCVARSRIRFANQPELRTDPRVLLDDPWYPEWANLKQPRVLDFSQSWATDGKPITLTVEEKAAPNKSAPPVVDGTKVTFTPPAVGDYYYQIRATDGALKSFPFHFFLPVFDAGIKRDDSHALLIYRFDEGTGNTIHDTSKIGQPLDMHIPKSAGAQWKPEQGLTMRGSTPPMTISGAEKLMAIKQSKACTIEFWVSTDTVYAPTHWSGCLLAWEAADHRNLRIGQHMNTLICTPQDATFESTYDDMNPNLSGSTTANGIRTGLQHLAITWDGSTTRMYANGNMIGQGNTTWNPAKWTAEASLLLGNQSDGQLSYIGTYYLLAIHDKALSDEQIRRHYNAGPSAK